jgi:murein DD-endopeptidase MepM/ murein hydrolase activator NlpD
MKLIPTNEALNIVDVGLLSIRQTTQGLRKSLGKEIRKDKQRETTKLSLDRLEVDTARTRDAEKIVEAKKPQNFIKGGISSAIKGSKSIFSGLLKAAGWILLDWLLANLPKIIVIVEDVTQFVKNLYDNIVRVFNSFGNVFRGIMDTAAALGRDLISGKIFTSEREVTQEFEELSKDFSQLQLDVDKTFKDTIKDLEDLTTQSEAEIADARQKLGLDPLPTTSAIPTGRSVKQQTQIAEAKERLDSGEITQQEYNQQVETIMQPPTTLPPSPPAQSRPAPTPGVEPQTSGLIFQDTGKKPPGYAIGDGIGAGRGHMGLDIPAESGSALTVPSDSTITDKGFEKNYGNYVVFMDANGLEHFYGHMLEQSPYQKNDKVKPGDIIGRVGSTGKSSGPHLHWELGKAEGVTGYPRKNAINPMDYGFPGTAPFTGEVVAAPQRLVSSLEGVKRSSKVASAGDLQEPIVVPFDLASLNISSGQASSDMGSDSGTLESFGQSSNSNIITDIQRVVRLG